MYARLFRVPYNNVSQALEEIVENGIRSIILFGIPRSRNTKGTSATSKMGRQKTLMLIKSNLEKNHNYN